MAVKKLIQNQPKFGDVSQYNFDEQVNELTYENSSGLPKNNGKFENKDLYTKTVSSELNNAIIERNLKYDSLSEFRVNKLTIENAGVQGKTTSNNVRCYMFSQAFLGKEPVANYDGINDALGVSAAVRFYNIYPGDRNRDSDIGELQSLTDQPIIQNLNSTNIVIEDFTNNDEVFDPNSGAGRPLQTVDGVDTLENTTIIDENVLNPIYIVIYMKGNKDNNVGGDTSRDRRFQVFKINNLDLFNYDSDGNATGKATTFEYVRGQGGGENAFAHAYNVSGGGDTTAAWKVGQFSITISTYLGARNDWEGDSDDADTTDEKKYEKYFTEVLQPYRFNASRVSNYDLIKLAPERQLNNTLDPGPDSNYSDTFPDFFPQTTIKILNKDAQMQDEDLQSYYDGDDDVTLSLKASAPATVAIELNPIDLESEQSTEINYFYFVIDWDDKDDKIKTFEDWRIARPSTLNEVVDLQNQGLYEIKSNLPKLNPDGSVEDVFKYIEQPGYFILNPDEFPVYFEQFDLMHPYGVITVVDAVQGWLNNGREDIYDVAIDMVFNCPTGCEEYPKYADILGISAETPRFSHTYTTPGIKTIKSIVFSYDLQGGQVGRWKLITSRFYLDIPINQYPDFAEVGGSEYTTIPWPFTTAIIGGVDENSNYKQSVRDTLGGGKIGDTDIIDERFLINDLENDELGKSINEMDLEQCRYFDTHYDIYSLLNITPVIELAGDDEYLDSQYLDELPFPEFFEEFDINSSGVLTQVDVNIWNTEYYRPDIADYVSNLISDVEEWENLPEQTFVGTVRLQTSFDFDTINQSGYWDGVLGTCTPQDNNNPNGEWAALYPNNSYDSWDTVSSDLGYSPLTFDAIDAGDVYFPEFCQNRSCIVERHVDCDSGWNGGTNEAYNVFAGRPPIENILPGTYLDTVELSVNLLSNGNFDLDDYDVIEWVSQDEAFSKMDVITGWTAVNINSVPGNIIFINPDNGGSVLLYSTTSDNLYIASPANTVISEKTYLVKIDTEYSETDNPPILEVGGGSNGVTLENGMNQFEWTPVFEDSGKVVIRRGGGAEPYPNAFSIKSISIQERYSEPGVPTFAGQIKLERSDVPPAGATPYIAMDTYPDMCYDDDGNGFGNYQLWWQMGLNSAEEAGNPDLVCNALFPNTTATILNPDEEGNHPCTTIMSTFEIPVFDCITTLTSYTPDFEQYINSEYLETIREEFYLYTDNLYYDGDENKFPEESSVGQIFITENQDVNLIGNCKLELNSGELTGNTIYDSSGNSNKGLLIGDYKVKKVRKGEPMRRDSFIKFPKKTGNKDGAL